MIFPCEEDLQALHHFEQQKAEYKEWIESEEAIDYINSKIMDAMSDDDSEIKVQ